MKKNSYKKKFLKVHSICQWFKIERQLPNNIRSSVDLTRLILNKVLCVLSLYIIEYMICELLKKIIFVFLFQWIN